MPVSILGKHNEMEDRAHIDALLLPAARELLDRFQQLKSAKNDAEAAVTVLSLLELELKHIRRLLVRHETVARIEVQVAHIGHEPLPAGP